MTKRIANTEMEPHEATIPVILTDEKYDPDKQQRARLLDIVATLRKERI